MQYERDSNYKGNKCKDKLSGRKDCLTGNNKWKPNWLMGIDGEVVSCLYENAVWQS